MPPIFPLTFSFGVVVAPWFLVGVLQRFFPPGGFLLQFVEVGLPPLWRWRAWMAESSRPYVLRNVYLVPVRVSPLLLLRFDVPGVLVSGSGLSASACSHAFGRFRGIALGPGAGFPFVSLPGGRVI